MKCYLCGCAELCVRHGVVRDAPQLKILECSNCGLVMLDSQCHIAPDHYQNSGMHGASIPSMESWLRDNEQDDQRRFEMLKPVTTNAKVLDFGCGAGGFLCKVASVASQAEGVELERRVRDYWRDKLVLHGTIDEAGFDYDLITAFHVIEHLSDPRTMLQILAGRLKTGGRLVIEVPSSEDALLTLYASEAFQNFTYWSQHLFLFNAETLRHLALMAGLRIVSIQQYQRYPLSNHLHWLTHHQPGGHRHWSFLDTPALNEAYAASLAAVGRCDTLIAYLEQA